MVYLLPLVLQLMLGLCPGRRHMRSPTECVVGSCTYATSAQCLSILALYGSGISLASPKPAIGGVTVMVRFAAGGDVD